MGTAMLYLANSHRRVLLLVVVTVVALLTMVNWRIAQFEQLLQDGKVVRFALAPQIVFSLKRAKLTTSAKPNTASSESANGESCCW